MLTPNVSTAPQVKATSRVAAAAKHRFVPGIWLLRLVLILLCVASFFPTFYVLVVSFRPGESLFINSLIPDKLTLENYRIVLAGQFPLWVRNSLWIGGASAVLSVLLSTLAGFSFSRFRFPGRRYGILTLMILQMLPTTASLVAMYYAFLWVRNNLGLFGQLFGLGTQGALILMQGFGAGALAVWLMKNYIDSVPTELDEAAFMDGATHWQTFRIIIFPLIQPMLVAQFIFNFIGVYNEFVLSTIFLNDSKLFPLGVGVRFYLQNYNQDWGKFCAAAMMGSIPIMLIFLVAQRFLVEGLTRGALKG